MGCISCFLSVTKTENDQGLATRGMDGWTADGRTDERRWGPTSRLKLTSSLCFMVGVFENVIIGTRGRGLDRVGPNWVGLGVDITLTLTQI